MSPSWKSIRTSISGRHKLAHVVPGTWLLDNSSPAISEGCCAQSKQCVHQNKQLVWLHKCRIFVEIVHVRQHLSSGRLAMYFQFIQTATDYKLWSGQTDCEWNWKQSRVKTATITFKQFLIHHTVALTEDPEIKIDTLVMYRVFNKYVKNNNSELQSQTGLLNALKVPIVLIILVCEQC